jgi:copper chaperone
LVAGAARPTAKEEAMSSSTSERAALTAPDISCGHCVATIDRALGALDGVRHVATDEATKRIEVEYDPSRVSLDRIEATLDEEGYPVQK